jgi:hypothetical protein
LTTRRLALRRAALAGRYARDVMQRANDELLDEVFPAVPRKRELQANETLLSIEKARRLLG